MVFVFIHSSAGTMQTTKYDGFLSDIQVHAVQLENYTVCLKANNFISWHPLLINREWWQSLEVICLYFILALFLRHSEHTPISFEFSSGLFKLFSLKAVLEIAVLVIFLENM